MSAWNNEKLFIHIPKTAGISVTASMGKVNIKPHAPISDPDLPKLPSFTVIRNPYHRAVSWWKYSKQYGVDVSFIEYLNEYFDKPWPNWKTQFEEYTTTSADFYLGEFKPSIPMLDYITIDGKIAVDEILRLEDMQIQEHKNVSKFAVNTDEVLTTEAKTIIEHYYSVDLERFNYE
jgi:hypothetical protein